MCVKRLEGTSPFHRARPGKSNSNENGARHVLLIVTITVVTPVNRRLAQSTTATTMLTIGSPCKAGDQILQDCLELLHAVRSDAPGPVRPDLEHRCPDFLACLPAQWRQANDLRPQIARVGRPFHITAFAEVVDEVPHRLLGNPCVNRQFRGPNPSGFMASA